MKELEPGTKLYTAMGMRVLAVLSRRVDGWCVYVGAVPGLDHEKEWQDVAAHGDKQPENVARAIVATFFGRDPEKLPYVY